MAGICVTKALKNAKRIQAMAAHIIPSNEPLDGFASLLPLSLLARFHEIQPVKMEIRPDLAELARETGFPAISTVVQGPLFNGTLHFVQMAFTPGNFAPAYSQADPAGIGTDDLRSLADRAFAFDFNSSGRLDHLVLYRPGTGAIFIVKNNGGTFTPIFAQGDPGGGIGGFDEVYCGSSFRL